MLSRAEFCRNVIALALNIRNHFDKNRIGDAEVFQLPIPLPASYLTPAEYLSNPCFDVENEGQTVEKSPSGSRMKRRHSFGDESNCPQSKFSRKSKAVQGFGCVSAYHMPGLKTVHTRDGLSTASQLALCGQSCTCVPVQFQAPCIGVRSCGCVSGK